MPTTKNLSANGSKNEPIFDTVSYFLAKYPSKKSVIDAIKKIDKALLVPKLDIYFDDFDKTFTLSLIPKKIKIIKEED